MNFCPQCEAMMTKSTTPAGEIVFLCRCQLTIPGMPDDTLMAEGYLETTGGDLKHSVFIDQSPFDQAANIVLRDCPQCGLDFMVMIRIGVNETIMYSCRCGFRATHDEYMKQSDLGGLGRLAPLPPTDISHSAAPTTGKTPTSTPPRSPKTPVEPTSETIPDASPEPKK